MEQLRLLFNEAEVYADQEKPEPAPVAAHVRQKRSGSVRDIVPKDIKTVVVNHTLPEGMRQCPQCGEVMEDIGTEVKETLKIKPAEVYIQRDVYHTYACANCEKNDVSTSVVKTPKEPPLIPGEFASPEAVAHIAVQKFVMGSPLYRQEQKLKRQNILLSLQTMSNWLMWCTDNYLKYIYDELRRELVKHDLLHADETELQVLHEPGKAPPSRRVGSGCTGQVGMRSAPSCCMSTSRGGGRSTRRSFWKGSRGTCRRMGTRGTTVWIT